MITVCLMLSDDIGHMGYVTLMYKNGCGI